MNRSAVIITFLVVLLAGIAIGYSIHSNKALAPEQDDVALTDEMPATQTFTYKCSNGSFLATFDMDNGDGVELTFTAPGGRSFFLTRAVGTDDERYSSADGQLVFLIKDGKGSVREGGGTPLDRETYSDCVISR